MTIISFMIWFYFAALDSELEGSEDDAAADPLESLSDAGTRSSVLTIRNLSLRLSLSDVNTNDDHLIRDMVDADCYSISLFSLTMAHSDLLHEPAIAQPIVRDVHALMQAIEAFEDEDDEQLQAELEEQARAEDFAAFCADFLPEDECDPERVQVCDTLLRTFIFLWSRRFNITHAATNSLLVSLRSIFKLLGHPTVLDRCGSYTSLVRSLGFPPVSSLYDKLVACPNSKKCAKVRLLEECMDEKLEPRFCDNEPYPSQKVRNFSREGTVVLKVISFHV
jgi:hypothetical protein